MRRPSIWSMALVVLAPTISVFANVSEVNTALKQWRPWMDSPTWVHWMVFAPFLVLAVLNEVHRNVGSRQSGLAAPREDAVAFLRTQVRDQWSDELGTRQLRQPRPLRLRWRPTSRRVQVRSPDAGEREPNVLRGELLQHPSDTRPVADALVEAFRRGPRRQMVMLGEPGAGKSTLAILFAVAAIEKSEASDPVPVVLSAAGWDPHEHIEAWITRRLGEDYPELTRRAGGITQAERLLRDRDLLPILDGLDEVPPALLGMALEDLDRSAGSGLPMVITCRSDEFEKGVVERGALAQAAVVEIDPIDVQDAITYLTQAELEGSHRWDAVTAAMTREPEGLLARLLSTPLMISLARRVYHRPDSRPQELTEFTTINEARQYLLQEFLRVAYPGDRDRARARRWLVFVAHHLHQRVRNPNFEWWQLARAVPRWVAVTLIAIVITLPGLVSSFVSGTFSALGLASLAVLGVVAGLRVGHAAHAPGKPVGRRRVLVTVGRMLHDLGVAVATFSAISSVLLLTWFTIAPRDAMDESFQFFIWNNPDNGAGFYAAYLALAVFTVGIVSVAMGANRGGLPQRSVPRLRRLLPSLAMGIGAGLFVGAAMSLVAFSQDYDAYTVIGIGVSFDFLVAIPVGLARWLTTPVEQQKAHSPQAVLRADRAAILIASSVSGITMALIVGAIALTASDSDVATTAVPIGIVTGGLTAVLVLLCAGSAWMSYTVTRVWLALCGRLPWRLMRFLRAAHVDSGILRQVGPAYQLRHDLVQTHFAQQWSRMRGKLWRLVETPTRDDQLSGGYRRRPWLVLLAVVVTIVLFYLTVTFINRRCSEFFSAEICSYIQQ